MLDVTHLPPKEIIKCTSWNQAHSLGLEGYGRLEPGYHADFVILDSGWNPLETWIGGVPRWESVHDECLGARMFRCCDRSARHLRG